MVLDAKDKDIVRALQRDGRLTNLDLSTHVNLSPSPCLRRVRLLEESEVITGYTAIISPEAVGLRVTAFISITLARHNENAVTHFEDAIKRIDAVLECYLLTGQADYLLKVAVKDLDDYERFVRKKLHAISDITSITTSLVYGTIKTGRVLPIP